MQRTRKRRRQTCSKCGQSFSCSWINQHRVICLSSDENVYNSEVTQNEDNQENNSLDSLDFQQYDNFEIPENAVSEEPLVDNNSMPSISDVSSNNLHCSRLRSTCHLQKEDEDFFDTLMNEQESMHGEIAVPPTEIWNDIQEAEADFEQSLAEKHVEPTQSVPSNDAQKSKLEVLVLWLMLFLTSWQSQHGITDTALTALIKFMCHFFWLIGMLDNTMSILYNLFPKSHYKIKQILGIDDDDFYKYVVCPKCKSIYNYEDCFDRRSGQRVSAKCKYVPWPNHPHRNRRGNFTINNYKTHVSVLLFV